MGQRSVRPLGFRFSVFSLIRSNSLNAFNSFNAFNFFNAFNAFNPFNAFNAFNPFNGFNSFNAFNVLTFLTPPRDYTPPLKLYFPDSASRPMMPPMKGQLWA